MRVLVTSTPGTGHILPMVPVARALRDRGHQVTWATGPDARALVEGAGLEPVPAGLELEVRRQQFFTSFPEFSSLPPHQRRMVMFPGMFATLAARPMYDDLVGIVDAQAPDLIVRDPCELASPALARRLGVPCATIGFGHLFSDELLATAVAPLEEAGIWHDAGSPVPPDLGCYEHAYLHPLPPSLESVSTDRPIHLARPLGYDGSDDEAPPEPRSARARPSVYVTFGTELGPVAPWAAIIEALAALDVDALLTVGGQLDPASLGPLPSSVRVVPWVPQRQALAQADLVVSHGGSGAMIGAAAAGLPHLALPMAADQFENADLIAASGSGSRVLPAEVTPEHVASLIGRLLDEPSAQAAAATIAAEIAAMPGPDAAAQALEALVE